MIRLRGHFDGRSIVLDEPVPVDLAPGTAAEVTILGDREQALRDWQAFMQDWWGRPLITPPTAGRTWSREDLYERR